jgi:hypothetical protein
MEGGSEIVGDSFGSLAAVSSICAKEVAFDSWELASGDIFAEKSDWGVLGNNNCVLDVIVISFLRGDIMTTQYECQR